MSKTTSKPAGGTVTFRVIEGGLSKLGGTPEPVQVAGRLPGDVEAERLRRAIMSLPVPKVGLTVEQAIDEICSGLYSKAPGVYQRGAYLCDAIEDLGVRFQLANPALELARDGFLVLYWPQRLLDLHPELAPLHPLAHQYMHLG